MSGALRAEVYQRIFEVMPGATVIRPLRTGRYVAADAGFERLAGVLTVELAAPRSTA